MQIEKSIYISLLTNKQQIQVINNIMEQEFQKILVNFVNTFTYFFLKK